MLTPVEIKKYNSAPVKLILFMEAISVLVNQIFQVLLPWYILVSSDSILWLGVAGFATIAPSGRQHNR